MSIYKKFDKEMKHWASMSKEMDRAEYAALYDFVETSAKRLGIKEPVSLREMGGAMPFAAAMWLKPSHPVGQQQATIVINSGMEKLFGEQHFRRTLSDEVKALVGHELSHVKDGSRHLFARHMGAFALPLAFGAAYYILDKAYRKKEHSKESLSLPRAIKHVVIDEKLGFSEPARRIKRNYTNK